MEYHLEQWWTGFWGGWGNTAALQERTNVLAAQGFHVVDFESTMALWFWLVPRPKLLIVFARQAKAQP